MSLGLLSSLTFPDGIASTTHSSRRSSKLQRTSTFGGLLRRLCRGTWTEPSTLLMGAPWSSCRADFFLLLYLSLMDPGLTGDWGQWQEKEEAHPLTENPNVAEVLNFYLHHGRRLEDRRTWAAGAEVCALQLKQYTFDHWSQNIFTVLIHPGYFTATIKTWFYSWILALTSVRSSVVIGKIVSSDLIVTVKPWKETCEEIANQSSDLMVGNVFSWIIVKRNLLISDKDDDDSV